MSCSIRSNSRSAGYLNLPESGSGAMVHERETTTGTPRHGWRLGCLVAFAIPAVWLALSLLILAIQMTGDVPSEQAAWHPEVFVTAEAAERAALGELARQIRANPSAGRYSLEYSYEGTHHGG